ncbi:hypothetical protein C8J57DRAFT_1499798 [Mycena rebaudengoi]|nr:hypothetical protein C8J57DRAFT_1499798 [Mycena rebaudengoi]
MHGTQFKRTLASLLLASASCCHSAIITDISRLDLASFDFVVVGGGTAGSALANRLSEDPAHSVLVLEAGGSHEHILDLIVPSFGTRATPFTPYDWNFTTAPQAGLNGRAIPYPRGFVLGGSSSVNYMVYTRGTREDFDRVARYSGDAGWSWERLVPYMLKNERFGRPADGHDMSNEYDPRVHGHAGMTGVTLAGYPSEIDARVIQTTKDLRDEFPFNLDLNSGEHLGVGWVQGSVLNGERSSAATAYLAPEFVRRPNLQILLHARAIRVLPDDLLRKAFRTVEFIHNGIPRTVAAKKEVLLSAGSIGSATLLLHSGIGNATTLAALGIPPLHDLPSVGQNLTDHALLCLAWLVNSTGTYETLERNATRAAEVLAQWQRARQGPMVNVPVTHMAWLRAPRAVFSGAGMGDTAAGPRTAHYEMLMWNGLIGRAPPSSGNFFSISTAVVAPMSRAFLSQMRGVDFYLTRGIGGSVSLRSADPLADPVIDPNILGAEVDLAIMREAVKSAYRFAGAPAWRGYVLRPAVDLAAMASDAERDAYIRANTGTVFHPVGTAGMAPRGAGYGVVDPDLRVKGLRGLRVVDLAVWPFIPAAHTQTAAGLKLVFLGKLLVQEPATSGSWSSEVHVFDVMDALSKSLDVVLGKPISDKFFRPTVLLSLPERCDRSDIASPRRIFRTLWEVGPKMVTARYKWKTARLCQHTHLATTMTISGTWLAAACILFIALGFLWHRVCTAPVDWVAELALLGQPRKQKLPGTVVVCGGSIAGIITARICADHFERVILVDPETHDAEKPKTRILQYNAIHRLVQPDLQLHYSGVAIPAPARCLRQTILSRRSTIQDILFRLFKKDCERLNVTVMAGTVRSVGLSVPGTSVTSVMVRTLDGQEVHLNDIALVADCTGTTQAGLKWLRNALPSSIRASYKGNLQYFTISFAVPEEIAATLPIPKAAADASAIYGYAADFSNSSAFFIGFSQADNNTMLLCVGGAGELPRTVDTMVPFLLGVQGHVPLPPWFLATARILCEQCEGTVDNIKIATQSYAQYHLAPPGAVPSNFIAVGDSNMHLNPMHAQGFAKIILNGLTLNTLLTSVVDGIPKDFSSRYFKKNAARTHGLWDATRLHDYGFSNCEPMAGETKNNGRLLRWLELKLISAAIQDEDVAVAMWRIRHLVAAERTLLAPRLLWKILWTPSQFT